MAWIHLMCDLIKSALLYSETESTVFKFSTGEILFLALSLQMDPTFTFECNLRFTVFWSNLIEIKVLIMKTTIFCFHIHTHEYQKLKLCYIFSFRIYIQLQDFHRKWTVFWMYPPPLLWQKPKQMTHPIPWNMWLRMMLKPFWKCSKHFSLRYVHKTFHSIQFFEKLLTLGKFHDNNS